MIPAAPLQKAERVIGSRLYPEVLTRRSSPHANRAVCGTAHAQDLTDLLSTRGGKESHLVANPRILRSCEEGFETRPNHKIEEHIPELKSRVHSCRSTPCDVTEKIQESGCCLSYSLPNRDRSGLSQRVRQLQPSTAGQRTSHCDANATERPHIVYGKGLAKQRKRISERNAVLSAQGRG